MSARLGELLEDIERLEPFPQAAVRVLELALGDADAGDIVTVIMEDPGLTAKVLRLVNSAKVGSRVPVTSVQQAINRLGRLKIANLAMTSGCASIFMGYGESTPRSSMSLWRECLHCAMLARRLAQREYYTGAELAYTVGLLQNIGHIILDRFFLEERAQILGRVREGENMLRAERAILGMDHAFCGSRIALKWGLPEPVVQGIRFHHAPHSAREFEPLCAILNLAEDLTARSLWGWETSMVYPGYDGEVAQRAPRDEELVLVLQEARGEMADLDLAWS